MTKTYLELTEEQDSAHKFYKAIVENTNVAIRFGQTGNNDSSFVIANEARCFC